MTKKQKDCFVRAIFIIFMVLGIMIALSGCCTTPIQIQTTKTDTVYTIKTVRDTAWMQMEVKTQTIDTLDTNKVLVTPQLETYDTTLKIAGTEVRVKIRKKNTEAKLDMTLEASRKDSSKTVNTVKNTAVYEPYKRPWYEYLVLAGAGIIFLIGGFCLGWFLGKKL